MSKRFIETGFFRKPLIRSLQGPYKILFVWYITECDHAGFWNKMDLDIASLIIGHEFTIECVSDAFGDILIDCNEKWFMPAFIEFQYGELKENNRVHSSVIRLLEKENIDFQSLENKPLISPLQGVKDKDKDKDKVKDKIKDKDKNIVYPDFPEFEKYCLEALPGLNPDWQPDQISRAARHQFDLFTDSMRAGFWRDGYGNKVKNWKAKTRNILIHKRPSNFGLNAKSNNTSTQNYDQYD